MTEFLSTLTVPDELKSLSNISSIQSFEKLLTKPPDRKFYRSGAWYIGKLDVNQRIGWGQFKWLNGGFYEGYYKDNKRHGEGKYTLNDGSIYSGSFVNDLRHGYGESIWNNNESYCGQFNEDKRHGYGIYKWPDGSRFEGNFEYNLKSGFGEYYLSNGDKFEGIYKNDQRSGPGIFHYNETGQQDIGIWKGTLLIQICTTINGSFSFETFNLHHINASENPSHQKTTNIKSVQNSKKNLIQLDKKYSDTNIPSHFPYEDIINGIRTSLSPKGPLEETSEKLLHAASLGDCHQVRDILTNGLAHPDVCDKTGYASILGASVNCHLDIVNCLLDHGTDINQLNLEGLSALSACHILLYTQQNFIDNIAENMAKENLFNAVEIDRKTCAIINRNERKAIMSIYETILKPSNVFKKTKKALLTKANLQKRQHLSRLNSFAGGDSSRCSTVKTSTEYYSTDDEEIHENGFDPWKLDYYQKSMDHVKNVDEINNTFKEFMLQPELFRLDELTVPTPFSTIISQGADPMKSTIAKAPGELFTTTVASLFGYGKTSMTSVLPEPVLLPGKKQTSAILDIKNMFLKHINNERKPHLESMIKLLLQRGANPNSSSLPMPVLFFAIKSADVAAVSALLKQNADTSARLNHQNLCPLHISVALPCTEAIEITKILLQHGADPNLRDDYTTDITTKECRETKVEGRTPLHIVCCREDNYKEAQKIAKLLLQNGADPDLLCCGNSSLSLAIASGNDMIVDVLLKHKADPSLKLTHGLGSILCTATSFQAERKRAPTDRMKLIDKLVKNGGDLLTPVRISDKYPPGTVVDYAYHVFAQDRRIACTPYHALSSLERECYNSRKLMLENLGVYLRDAAKQKELENLANEIKQLEQESTEVLKDASSDKKALYARRQSRVGEGPGRDDSCGLRFVTIKTIPKKVSVMIDGVLSTANIESIKKLRYCYECGRSIGVRLSPCTRCKEIFYCSKSCKVKAWNERHREECAKGQKALKSQSRTGDSPTPSNDVTKKLTERETLEHTKDDNKVKKPNGFLPLI